MHTLAKALDDFMVCYDDEDWEDILVQDCIGIYSVFQNFTLHENLLRLTSHIYAFQQKGSTHGIKSASRVLMKHSYATGSCLRIFQRSFRQPRNPLIANLTTIAEDTNARKSHVGTFHKGSPMPKHRRDTSTYMIGRINAKSRTVSELKASRTRKTLGTIPGRSIQT
jgi:hypothetical protein